MAFFGGSASRKVLVARRIARIGVCPVSVESKLKSSPDCVRKRGNEVGWHTAKRNAVGFFHRCTRALYYNSSENFQLEMPDTERGRSMS